MKKIFLIVVNILFTLSFIKSQTTIEQRLINFRNDGTLGGVYSVDYEIKGTNLPTARTLGSLTLDILYNSTVLTFTSGSNWNTNISTANGCNRSIQASSHSGNIYRVRIGITTLGVNENGSGDPPGYDLISSFDRIVRINFTILNPALTSGLVNFSITNQIGLYQNLHNEPMNNIIINQTLMPFSGIDEPLPISLSSFTSIVNKNVVDLKWKTASETNNKEFEIERRVNGSKDWLKTGTVQGKGNSSLPVDYAYTDRNLKSGKYEYRLKQIDINGNFEYHNLNGIVTIDVPLKFELSQNYPNPFNPLTTINYALQHDSYVKMSIYDIIGREIKNIVNENQKAGYYNLKFDASGISSGVYFYRISASNKEKNFSEVKKMMIVK